MSGSSRQATFPPGVALIERDSSTSTSAELIALARSGAAALTLLTTKIQSAGHGQYGRPFFSPEGGAYFSLLLRPELRASIAEHVTLTAAVAVSEACEAMFPVTAGIKPVNDVLINRKKVAGILAEAFDGADGFFVVLGIGVNLATPRDGFPAEFPNAGAVSTLAPDELAPNAIMSFIADTTARFLRYFDLPYETVRREYDARLLNSYYSE